VRAFAGQLVSALVITVLLTACGDHSALRRTLRKAGAPEFRSEALKACREGFATGSSQQVPKEQWPAAVRAFQPLGLWAEPDGAYLLIDSDADGERGLYLPRIVSEKDPLCSPALKHVKLAEGVYWYEKRRG
jgi:hypothetical protein